MSAQGAAAIAAAVRRGELRATEVAEAALAEVRRLDPSLGAFLAVTGDAARQAAAAVDARVAAGEDPGPLAGVPLGIKDNLGWVGAATTAGSRHLAGYRPPFTATGVARLLAAGAVPLGKLNLDEFAMGSTTVHSAFGPTRNPWDLARVPGGSSGGPAAAVAAGLVALALGSDTGGSIRQPAALCGCVGVRPTYGLVSRAGLVAFASSLDQVGPLARDVADAALALDALWGPDPADPSCRDPARPAVSGPLAAGFSGPAPFSEAVRRGRLEGLVLGAVREHLDLASADVRAALSAALAAAERAGAVVREVSLPSTSAAAATYQVLAAAEASTNLARYDGVRFGRREAGATAAAAAAATRAVGFGAEVKRRVLLGTFVLSRGDPGEHARRAARVRQRIRREHDAALAGVDALVGPTAPAPAFGLGELTDPLALYELDALTVGAALAGLPAVSLPCGLTPAGLPVGLQLTGAAWSDPALLGAARALEQVLPGARGRPRGLP